MPHEKKWGRVQRADLSAFVALSIFCLVSGPLVAAEVYIYPKNGQSAEQQETDESQCRSWATNQTGFDPVIDSENAEDAGKGKVAKNTAIGVAGGAAGGALLGHLIGGRAGLGAAAGAGLGGLMGARKGVKSKEEARDEAEGADTDYNRALKACLEGRGYSVS